MIFAAFVDGRVCATSPVVAHLCWLNKAQEMALSFRLVVRYVRVLVACAVLGIVKAPPPAATWVDAVAWNSDARNGEAAARGTTTPLRHATARVEAAVASTLARYDRASCEHAALAPAGARSIIVHDRLYMRHAALLC